MTTNTRTLASHHARARAAALRPVGVIPAGATPAGSGPPEAVPAEADPPEALPAAVATLDAAIDAIVQVEAALRRLTAFRTVLIDAARRQVPAAEAALLRPASDAARGRDTSARPELAERAFVADLATALQCPEVTTRALVEDARSLVHALPTTLEALGSGAISYRHAQVMIEQTAGLCPEARRAVESAGLPFASSTTPTGLARRLRRARERVHPEPSVVRHRRAAEDRRVRLDPAADGMSWLSAFLPAVAGHAIMDRLDHAAGAVAGPDEARTPDQVRADALAALLLDDPHGSSARAFGSVTSGRSGSIRTDAGDLSASVGTGPAIGTDPAVDTGPTIGADATVDPSPADDAARLAHLARNLAPRVAVTVPALTLLGHEDEPGELEGYGPVDADTARALAAGAPSFTRILTHPHSGAVLSVGRESYTVPADLRRHLAVRDGTCRFPGCERRAAACDVDHVVAFVDGGCTDADNLVHLCRRHHRLKHETSWRVTRAPAPGTLVWTSPTGRVHESVPATALPPTDPRPTPETVGQSDAGPPPF